MKRVYWWLVGMIGLLAVGQSALAQNVDDFTIQSLDAEYHLSRASDNRSVLKTREVITVTFPDYDQNHGIERALPQIYDGHTTNLQIDSVTNQTGQDVPYELRSSNDSTVVRIGDPNTYVHGINTYILTYTQHDVTRYFSDTNRDEWYWDINGTQWRQSIDRVRAHVTVDPALHHSVMQRACYQGEQGASMTCDGTESVGDGEYIFTAHSLAPNQTLTVALGFSPQTFAAYQPTVGERIWAFIVAVWLWLLAATAIGAVAVVVWMSVQRHQVMNRHKGRGTIVPEYVPTRDYSVLISAQVAQTPTTAITAQILDLAVRHYIKIYQVKEKRGWHQAEYELELVQSPDALRVEERRLINVLFGGYTTGKRVALKRLANNYTLRQKLLKGMTKDRVLARGVYGLFEKATAMAARLNKLAVILLIAGIVTVSPFLIIAAIIGFVYAYTLWPLTASGRELKEYLDGLKHYIEVAEKERLRMMQSPRGAEKIQINSKDPRQLVKLYERVLPYAVLFGQSKQWLEYMGRYYDKTSSQPDWYAGNAAFNATLFASTLSSFNSQMTSYSSPASSSSGGSSGGGSAGGGGGGGGGGGW